jgi:hypothetical protein
MMTNVDTGVQYQEVMGRGKFRYDIRPSRKSVYEPIENGHISEWSTTAKRILGSGCICTGKGFMLSQPGSTNQEFHSDGNFSDSCYALAILIPLQKMDESLGPTELVPSSHLCDTIDYTNTGKHTKPIPFLGNYLVMDYRLGHRGTKNVSNQERFLYYETYSIPGVFDDDQYNYDQSRSIGRYFDNEIPNRSERSAERRRLHH